MNELPLRRRVLIVGEGRETEYNYFVGFREAFEAELKSTATSVVVRRGKGGNARGIVENAIVQMQKFKSDRKRGDCVFVLLDTEGPGRAPELPEAEKLAESKGIEIVYSSPAFEYWLLCHFEKVSRRYFEDCESVIVELNKKWKSVCHAQYDKADQDIFDRLSDRLDLALKQALKIDLYHLTTQDMARRMNPSTQIYELIAILIGARTGETCPTTGHWRLVGDDSVKIELEKGGVMPTYQNYAANWRL